MAFAGGDDVVAGLFLLQHQPHRPHVVAGVAPVAPRIEVAEDELLLEAERDRRSPVRDLARKELQRSAWRLVVVEDPRARVQPVTVPVRAYAEVRIRLRDSVGRHRRQRRVLRLRNLLRVAEDLRRRRLVEADSRIDQSDRLEQRRSSDGGELGRLHGLLPRGRHEGGRRKVVDLRRASAPQRLSEGGLVQEVGLLELDSPRDRGEVLVARRTRSHEPAHGVACVEQQLGEERAVLPADAGDQSSLHATIFPEASA